MATKDEIKAALREVLSESGNGAAQAVQSIAFIDSQVNGHIATDRSPEGQLAYTTQRTTDILLALDGRESPFVKTADGKPAVRAIAKFLRREGDGPSGADDVDEAAIARLVLEGLAGDLDSLAAIIRQLPADTVAAFKAAL